jgi:hypothetical protein
MAAAVLLVIKQSGAGDCRQAVDYSFCAETLEVESTNRSVSSDCFECFLTSEQQCLFRLLTCAC